MAPPASGGRHQEWRRGEQRIARQGPHLLDDSRALAEAINRADGEVKLDVRPEMQHVFHFLADTAPEGDDAIGRLAARAARSSDWRNADRAAGQNVRRTPAKPPTGAATL